MHKKLSTRFITSGVSVQCEMPFKSRGMCAGYNQSNRNPYVRRLRITNMKNREISLIPSLCLNNRNSTTTNLFVAIAIPLRSLIKPTSAYLTASVRNTASGVDSKLRKT